MRIVGRLTMIHRRRGGVESETLYPCTFRNAKPTEIGSKYGQEIRQEGRQRDHPRPYNYIDSEQAAARRGDKGR